MALLYFFTYKPISAISRDPESQGLYARLKLPPQKSKTIPGMHYLFGSLEFRVFVYRTQADSL